jgi:hypothetical protein
MVIRDKWEIPLEVRNEVTREIAICVNWLQLIID